MIDVTFDLMAIHLKNLLASPYLQTLFWVIFFDVFSGVIKAFKLKQYNSSIGIWGLLKHILVFSTCTVIAMYARILDHREVGIAVCVFFIANYIGSLMENWEALGLPFPEWAKPYINQIRKDTSKKMMTSLKIESEGKQDDGDNR